ncbi:unnamed protein product [Heligmosomoides polygyrus]|uniref:SLC3A2_N domain-containing protein n=1 Tax=Heligmosomoides polygyrus TaxID=6339 RepID=A0A183FZA4_HELPZ|nr:unnamed protein product [Heligmosomoides polygyrus]
MFASTVCGGATTFTQRWWLSLVGVPSAVDLTEFEPDSDQLMNIEMEEHEMWTKTPSRRETLQMTNNRRMPQPLSEKDRSYIAGIIFTSVIAVALITLAIVMWIFIL